MHSSVVRIATPFAWGGISFHSQTPFPVTATGIASVTVNCHKDTHETISESSRDTVDRTATTRTNIYDVHKTTYLPLKPSDGISMALWLHPVPRHPRYLCDTVQTASEGWFNLFSGYGALQVLRMYWQIWLAAGAPCAAKDVLTTSRPRLLEPATGKPDSNKGDPHALYHRGCTAHTVAAWTRFVLYRRRIYPHSPGGRPRHDSD